MTAAELYRAGDTGSWRARATATLVGAAVGDALGGAAEGNSADAIRRRYGGYIDGIVEPFLSDWRTARPIAPYHKGDGHITDDTLMTHALVEVYERVRDHLDAYAVAEHLVPLMIGETRWIPELETEALLLQRVFLAEKWLVARLHYGHVDPREAGVGNVVNCGATMYMAPVAIVNAADPVGAYAEAIDVAGAHQSSFGREAAGVFAAAVAAALAPGAGVDDVVQAAIGVAHDGTKAALAAVLDVAAGLSDWRDGGGHDGDGLAALRAAIAPYDSVGEDYRQPSMDARRPSRTKSIEELPIAIALVALCKGDYREAVLGAVNYGRDSDSIATMAGAIAGALGGLPAIPDDWHERVAAASRLDLAAPGAAMAQVAAEVWERDAERVRRREAARQRLG